MNESMRRKIYTLGRVVVLIVLVTAWHAAFSAVTWTFQQVASTGDAAPGGGTFTGFSAPSFSSGSAAFLATTTTGQGIYLGSPASIALVTATSFPAPGGGTFSGFGNPDLSGATAAFFGTTTLDQGVYSGSSASTTLIANTSFAAPGGGTFTGFGDPAIDGSTLAFRANTSSAQGIYAANSGTLTRIATISDAAPGGGMFTGFGNPDTSNGAEAFRGTTNFSGGAGIYTATAGTLSAIALAGTTVAPGGGLFTSFGDPSISSDSVAFVGTTASGQGIYVDNAGLLSRIATAGGAIPGGSGAFTSFNAPAANDGFAAFEGFGAPGFDGIYSNLGGVLAAVIDNDQTLGTNAISDLSFSGFGFDGRQLAFAVTFIDRTQAIFIATAQPQAGVPEPSTLALFTLGLLAFVGFVVPRRSSGIRRRS